LRSKGGEVFSRPIVNKMNFMSFIEALFALLIGVVVLMAITLFVICRPAPRRQGDASSADPNIYVADSGHSVHSGHSGHSDHGCVSHDGFSDSCSSGGHHF